MLDKYVISNEEGVVIALKYHLQNQSVALGGPTRFVRTMEALMTTYFQVEIPKATFPQRNKVRYEFPCERQKFLAALKEMEKQYMAVTPVDRLERIMR